MNDKLIAAVNKMIENSGRMSDILKEGNEFYFKYQGATFSTVLAEDAYRLYVYPRWTKGTEELRDVYRHLMGEFDDLICYKGEGDLDILFGRLHAAVEQKYFGVDDIFDAIIDS